MIRVKTIPIHEVNYRLSNFKLGSRFRTYSYYTWNIEVRVSNSLMEGVRSCLRNEYVLTVLVGPLAWSYGTFSLRSLYRLFCQAVLQRSHALNCCCSSRESYPRDRLSRKFSIAIVLIFRFSQVFVPNRCSLYVTSHTWPTFSSRLCLGVCHV